MSSNGATVRACGGATVRACGGATVRAYGGATVRACGGATVRVRRFEGAITRAFNGTAVRECIPEVRRYERTNARLCGFVVLLCLLAWPAIVPAQSIERITFDEAIRRVTTNNPTVQQAAAGILRAEALLQQITSRTRPSVDASVGADVIDPVTSFDGTTA